MNISKEDKIFVVSHDAGGAEVLSAFLKHHSFNFESHLEGPSEKIFNSKFENLISSSLSEKHSLLLTSTSWKSDIEYEHIILAKKFGIKTVSLLDHWCNYKDRFIRDGVEVLPHEIWLGDDMALKIAKECFPSTKLKVIENYYLKDLKKELGDSKDKVNPLGKILYVCEPLSEYAKLRYNDERYWGYTEKDALRFFLSNIEKVYPKHREVIVRQHPSEKEGKYDDILIDYKNLEISYGGDASLMEEIMSCDNVVGCESIALVVALTANKKVFSSIPHGGRTCLLPHENIVKLSKLVPLSK